MPLSLRIPPEKERLIEKASKKEGKSKSAYILDAVDEKLGVLKNRKQLIKDMAGWLTNEEAEELRRNVNVFNQINEEDWN